MDCAETAALPTLTQTGHSPRSVSRVCSIAEVSARLYLCDPLRLEGPCVRDCRRSEGYCERPPRPEASEVFVAPKRAYKSFHCKAETTWSSARRGMLSAVGRPNIVVGSPPEFKGEPDVWAPEELLVGSLNTCIACMPGSSTTPGCPSACVGALGHIAFHYTDSVGTRNSVFYRGSMAGLHVPYRRFADILADACARLGADVVRYSFIVVDLHHLLLAGLPAHLCKNSKNRNATRMIFFSSTSKLNSLASWATKAVLDE